MPKAIVIDDARVMRLILANALSEVGFTVCQAANGKEALSVLEREQNTVSLGLVDWNMPEMNGLEFVKKVRADGRYADLKLIMVTTETEVEQMVRALEAGADEYVMKPFTKEVVTDKLRLMGIIE